MLVVIKCFQVLSFFYEFFLSNIWPKRAVLHPRSPVQEQRQGKKILTSASANTEMFEATTRTSTEADTPSNIPFTWKPIIGNNFVEDVNYNKFDEVNCL